MIRVLVVFGTRPEAIKMAPVIQVLKEHEKEINVAVCVTAQHREMLDQVLSIFDVVPDYDLDLMKPGQDLFSLTNGILDGIRGVILDFKPDWVLVHGDTTTSFATALASFYLSVKVGHVEAGLRTFDLKAPFPEEANRQLTARLASAHFAPTKLAASNLLKEGICENSVVVTGNTVIDSLLQVKENLVSTGEYNSILAAISPAILSSRRLVLITAHRRENFGLPIRRICEAIKKCAHELPDTLFIYPVHPNPNIKEPVFESLREIDNVLLHDPLSYTELVCVMDRASLIMTDSGGIQEEAPSFGKKTLVLRDVTERQEALDAGVVELVGSDVELIVGRVTSLIATPVVISENPFGDGFASKRIVDYIIQQYR